ncbi:hypothetical protein GCM10029963_21330 [Micromonospora andamanensis]
MTVSHAEPVTVAVARRADPARTDEMVAWMRAGTALAEAFPGFLGAGWVRSAPDPATGTCSTGSPTRTLFAAGRNRRSDTGG